MEQNSLFLLKAEALKPRLNLRTVIQNKPAKPMKKGDVLCLDFQEHLVGTVRIRFGFSGSHPDAPVWLRLKFAERALELEENVESYHGWISASWIQQEQVHIYTIPSQLELPHRYAFRYIQLEVLDISSKYMLTVESVECTACSSADENRLQPYHNADKELEKIDRIACRTLHDCMQSVFEDGPKRDRRLWMGDLRLQALANYQTYRQNDLVKRCLYLFAGSTLPGGRVGAGIFVEPSVEADDTVMFDYSLFFIPTLLDYYQATGDLDTLSELWPTAWRQITLSQDYFASDGLIRDSEVLGWCFVDWNLSLNKQASAQGIYLYCLKAAEKIAEILGDEKRRKWIVADCQKKKTAAVQHLFDRKKKLFISGSEHQISWASQIWMVLGGATESGDVLSCVEKAENAVKIVTPYLYHHYVQALLDCGEKEKAEAVLSGYWGGMMRSGADTFWELYNPDNPDESPYGGTIVNSYCHAWSCAPAYFLRKYF